MPRRATRLDDFPNRDLLDDLAFGLHKAAVLKAAIELEVFTRIAEGHRTLPALARICNSNERGTRILLDALCFTGLLTKQQGEYHLSPTAEAFLVKGKPSYYGDAQLGDFSWDARGQLSKVIRTGKPIAPAAFSDVFEPMWARSAAVNLVDWQRQLETVNALWEKIDIPPENLRRLRLLDIASGAGILSFALAKKHASVRVTMVDRPMVLTYVKQIAEKMDVASQVTLVSGDPFNFDVRAQSFDLVVLGNVTQYLSTEQNIGIFRKAYESLAENGRVIVHAPIVDEEHKGPGEVPLAGAELLLFSGEGDIYTFAEYRGMLETAGFSEITNYRDEWGLVSARRIEKLQAKVEK